MITSDNIFKKALSLKPSEKARLLDKLLSSLDKSDKKSDTLWAKEPEDRIDAYDRGELKSVTFRAYFSRPNQVKGFHNLNICCEDCLSFPSICPSSAAINIKIMKPRAI